jgi:hypothetical protein
VKAIVAIDSNHDDFLDSALEYRRRDVYPYLEKTFRIYFCQECEATDHDVRLALGRDGVRFITGTGHGFRGVFTGQWLRRIFQVNGYGGIESAGKVVHLLSCHTAEELGRYFVREGCRAFFGYNDLFVGYMDESDEQWQLILDVFWECASEVDIAISEGETASRAFQRTCELYRFRIRELADEFANPEAAAQLEHNLEAFCGPPKGQDWGDPTASV